MFIELLLSQHPLAQVGLAGFVGLILGTQAGIGANLAHRRGLEWQTGFILGLVFTGFLVALLYSTRPIEKREPLIAPTWLSKYGKWPAVVTSAIALVMTGIMEAIFSGPPVTVANAPIFELGLVTGILSIPALIFFVILGGAITSKWFGAAEPLGSTTAQDSTVESLTD